MLSNVGDDEPLVDLESVKNLVDAYRKDLDDSILSMKQHSDREKMLTKENTELKKEVEAGRSKIMKLEEHMKILTKEFTEMVNIVRTCFPNLDASPEEVCKSQDQSRVFSMIKNTVLDLIEQRNQREMHYEENEISAYNLRNEYYAICEKVKILQQQKESLSIEYEELCESISQRETPVNSLTPSNCVSPIIYANANTIRRSLLDINSSAVGSTNKEIIENNASIEQQKILALKEIMKKIRQHVESKTSLESELASSQDGINLNDDPSCLRFMMNFLNSVSNKIKLEHDEFTLLSKECKELEYAMECRRMFNEMKNQKKCSCGINLTEQTEKLAQIQLTLDANRAELNQVEAQWENVSSVYSLLQLQDLDIDLSDLEDVV